MLQKEWYTNFLLITYTHARMPHTNLGGGVSGPRGGIPHMTGAFTFAFCNFCIHFHQEKTLRALIGRKLNQLLALELLEQTEVQIWGWQKHPGESRLRNVRPAVPSDF